MPLLTLDEVRDAVARELREALPSLEVLDVGSNPRLRAQAWTRIELPVVTYALTFQPDYRRVVDEITTVDVARRKVTIEEAVPYTVRLVVGAHSDIQAEAESIIQTLHRRWGRAPCFGGVGWHLEALEYSGLEGLVGIYNLYLVYEGWVRLAGPRAEFPMIEHVEFGFGRVEPGAPAYGTPDFFRLPPSKDLDQERFDP